MNHLFNRIRQALSRMKVSCKIFAFPNKYYVYDKSVYTHHRLSFSQEGEDMILSRMLEGRALNKFYVDVGAHHPQRFSNTYHFYLQGWRGINIDPLPGGMGIFREVRPRDINLEYAISDKEEELTYYEFNEPALNGFSLKLAKERDGLKDYRIVGEKNILTRRLEVIFEEHLPHGQQIGFLNIDVEGHDLQVLLSNNWDRYRPEIILIEDLEPISLGHIQNSPIVSFLSKQGYDLYAKSVNTLFFIRDDN